ncbi:DUF4240 domain-containing protein [Bacillus manliponensis]|uniref:DUF4240 domain-containing protein n=1 Tax=Bacillus manliponensis TaxID=574376 RepID=UPI003518C91E
MEKLLLYKDASSNKFWKINVSGKSFTVTYGKVGSIGSMKVKEFESNERCEKEAMKLIHAKLKKGYETTENEAEVIKESTMTEELFWELIDMSKKKSEYPEEQVEWLSTYLSRKPVREIIEFDFILQTYHHNSYSSHLWAAAYIIMGGCSDDSFDYFRAWLIVQGKDVFEAAIEDPETLIPTLKFIEEDDVPELEDLLFVAAGAYEEKTGKDFDEYDELYHQIKEGPYDFPNIEFDWDDDDDEGLKNKFPKLWGLYGEEPLGY